VILTYHVQRRSTGSERPDYFVRRTSRRPWLEVVEGVPPFDGPDAYFEVEKLPKKPLRFIRQVEQPSWL
jgi:hypothetical protein